MVLLTCPWCEEEEPVDFDALTSEYHCEGCGTTTELAVDAEEVTLALAA